MGSRGCDVKEWRWGLEERSTGPEGSLEQRGTEMGDQTTVKTEIHEEHRTLCEGIAVVAQSD